MANKACRRLGYAFPIHGWLAQSAERLTQAVSPLLEGKSPLLKLNVKEYKMQKWEYLTIVAKQSQDFWFRPTWINNQEIKDWEKGSLLVDYINKLGDEGWELVSEYMDTFLAEWHYRDIFADSDWRSFSTDDGKKYKGLEGYMQYINEMGKAGWELTTTAVQTSSGGFPGPWLLLFKLNYSKVTRLRFKRPKP